MTTRGGVSALVQNVKLLEGCFEMDTHLTYRRVCDTRVLVSLKIVETSDHTANL